MTTATLQTPLEVILFFTSLATHGVKPQSFQTISEILKKDNDVRESDGYDEARLSPASLQQLYLALLKDEVRNQARSEKSPSPSGLDSGTPNARKRKISSPALQSLSDAQEHEHLLPILVDKLYARYRDQALKDIAKEEDAYRSLQTDIAKIGQSESKNTTNGGVSSIHSSKPLATSAARGDVPVASKSATPVADQREAQAERVEVPQIPTEGLLPSPAGALAAGLYKTSVSPSTPGQLAMEPHHKLLPSNSTQSYPLKSDTSQPSTPLSSVPNTQGQPRQTPLAVSVSRSNSPRGQNQGQATHATYLSQSPAVPPSGNAGGSQMSAATSAQSTGYRPGHVTPNLGAGQTQQNAQSPIGALPAQYQPGQKPGIPSYSQSSQSHQGTPQAISPYGAYPLYSQNGIAQAPIPGQNSPYQYPGAQGHLAFPGTPQQTLASQGRTSTPGLSTSQRRVLPKTDTSTPSTKWKSTGPQRREKTPPPPPLSPMDLGSPDLGSSPESDSNVAKDAGRKGGRISMRGTPLGAEDTPSRPSGGRGRGGRGRGGRGGSAMASARTRSHSVTSQTEEQAMSRGKAGSRKVNPEPGTPLDEHPPSDSNLGTPLPPGHSRLRRDTLRSIEAPNLSIRPGQKRKRANTLEVGSPVSPGPLTSRFPPAPTRPGYVLGVRNLPRIAATILNDVTTHKLASMFQKPISEREAPGYRDYVFQPQDLKTIRSQLQAGQRAIIAADAAAQDGADAGTPGGNAGVSKITSTIWLERNSDVLPPKAIVNSSQLETELCRIFANAVVFNPDPKRGVGPAFRTRAKRADAQRQGKEFEEDEDDEDQIDDYSGAMVNDAREMFKDIERQLAGWRAAERTSFGTSGMGTDGAADEDQSMDDAPEDEKEDLAEGDEGRGTRRRKA